MQRNMVTVQVNLYFLPIYKNRHMQVDLCDTVQDTLTKTLDKLDLPLADPTGSAIPYELRLESKPDTILQTNKTLSEIGVSEGDVLVVWYPVHGGCFPDNAQVLLPSGGTVAISSLEKGHTILVYDPGLRIYTRAKLKAVCKQEYSESILLNDVFMTTPDQTMLMANHQWKKAGDLVVGDNLMQFPFGQLEVISVHKQQLSQLMVSLAVPEMLCFVVDGFVVRDYIGKQFSLNDSDLDWVYSNDSVDVFLSYSTADRRVARQILAAKNANKLRIFLAEDSVDPGDKWDLKIKSALRNCQHFWILATPSSLKSEWVISEWSSAWVLKKNIVPILSGCTNSMLPNRLQRYHSVKLDEVPSLIENVIQRKDAANEVD